LSEDIIPRTTYSRVSDFSAFEQAQEKWAGVPYSRFHRLAWRAMIDPKAMERSLYAALIPPGVSHVHAVHSLSMSKNLETAVVSGFWASLPLDYVLRVVGRTNLSGVEARFMPAPQPAHPLTSALLLRTLRLNCLSRAYADLWNELYETSWVEETWCVNWSGLPPLGAVQGGWEWGIPLRSERGRRAALVEIDALVAVWLGIGIDELIAILRSRYPILTDREDQMWFDAYGRKIAADSYTFGFGQTKEHYEQLMAYLDDPKRNPVPEGYTPPFYKAD